MLAIAAGNVAAWARSEPGAYDNAPQRFLQMKGRKDETVAIRLLLMGPGCSWMLAAGSDDDVDGSDEKPSTNRVASFHKLMNCYMEPPLAAVKYMPLRWERKAAPADRAGDRSHPPAGRCARREGSLIDEGRRSLAIKPRMSPARGKAGQSHTTPPFHEAYSAAAVIGEAPEAAPIDRKTRPRPPQRDTVPTARSGRTCSRILRYGMTAAMRPVRSMIQLHPP